MKSVVAPASAAAGGLVLILCANAAMVDLTGPVIYPALGIIVEEFDVSPGQAQLLVTAHVAGAAITQPLLGPAGDYFGRTRVLIASLVGLGVLSLLAGFAPSFTWLLIARIAQGMIGSAGIVLGRAIARDQSPDASACTRIVSYIVITTGVCSLAGPVLAGWLIAWGGWQLPLLIMGAASLVVAALTAWWSKSIVSHSEHRDPRSSWPGWPRAMRMVRTPCFYGNTLLLGASMGGMFTLFGMIPLWFGVQRSASALDIGAFMSGVSLAFIVGAALASRIPAPRSALLLLSTAIAAGYALVAAMSSAMGTSAWSVLPGSVLVAVAAGFLNPITLTRVLDADSALTGTAAGFSSSLSLAMLAGAAQLSAVLFAASPSWLVAVGLGYAAVCWFGAVASLRSAPSRGLPIANGTYG